MSHGWFVLLMALAVIVVVAFFAWAVRFMVREFGGRWTAGISIITVVAVAGILMIVFAAAGALR